MFDFGAKTLNVNIYKTCVSGMAIAPHFAEQSVTGKYTARLFSKGD
jgi:hypothetical protein